MNMKVIIATGIYPPDIGGPATIIKELKKSLEMIGYQVKIITYADRVENETNVYRINRKGPAIFVYLKYFYKLLKLQNWAYLIYVTDIYSVGYFAYLLKRMLGKRYIIRFAGDSAWEAAVAQGLTKDYILDFQKNIYDRKIEKLKNRRKKIMVNADLVIVVSNFMSEVAKLIGVKSEKIRVIYNAVDFENKNDFNKEQCDYIKKEYKKNGYLIITACRLTPWKGVEGIISILPRLNRELGRVSLVVLGDGGELENLKSLAKELNVADLVYFLGRVERKKMINYFKAGDLFVLNSNYEGLSHTLLEAMQAGLPVVATNIGGNPEVIENGKDGLLVPYRNNEELFKACLNVLTQPTLAQKFQESSAAKLNNFSWSRVVNQTDAVLKEISHE